MANRYCELSNISVNPLPVRDFLSVEVPSGDTYYQGDVVEVGSMSTTAGEDALFAVDALTDATAAGTYGIVVNQGVEVLSDGRMPTGNRDISTLEYGEGEIINIKLFNKGDMFIITEDCFTGVEVAGKYLITANGTTKLAVADDLTGSTTVALKIEKLMEIPIGYDYTDAVLARVVVA